MSKIHVGIIVGSLRKDSFSKKVAQVVASFLPDNYEATFVDISNLPMFNQDFDDEGTTPKEWIDFREEIKNLDTYIFVTPEYNRSIPPVLKNALDVASRPYGQNVWTGKPGAVISVSPGITAGFGANHHLRQTLSFLNVYTMQQPEAYLSNIIESLDNEGNLTKEHTLEYLKSITAAYVDWVSKFQK
ncbi:MAG TPA: NAD(P)H-dependent oxidoreductase [Candidatus Merdenecus merdavium]|nr:NAD(P)H-dependent oxidoreductase [Candidatus Merdenecus merdavium]